MELFTLDNGEKKMLIFPTGRVYKCAGDLITECKPKIEICIERDTLKVYKFAYINFEYSRYSLAKLVAEAFVENPDNYPHVRRINGDPADNSATNLEWIADRRQHTRVSRDQLLLVEPERLGVGNKAVYQLLMHDDESALLQLLTRPPLGLPPQLEKANLYRYLYESLAKHQVPSEYRSLRMDEGYELVKRRLLTYYYPYDGMLGEGRLRKYCYFCYVYNALDKRGETFIPRELSRKINSEQVFDFF